jgi:hypothetical protein
LKIDELHYIAIYQLCDSDTVKISDFGLSTVFRHMGKERKVSRRCGTPPYIAHVIYPAASCAPFM